MIIPKFEIEIFASVFSSLTSENTRKSRRIDYSQIWQFLRRIVIGIIVSLVFDSSFSILLLRYLRSILLPMEFDSSFANAIAKCSDQYERETKNFRHFEELLYLEPVYGIEHGRSHHGEVIIVTRSFHGSSHSRNKD